MDLAAPLPPQVVKQLNDRVYEKRKAGALEIEKYACLNLICVQMLFYYYYYY